MAARPAKTTVKRCGKSGFEIKFSARDGRRVADRMKAGENILEVVGLQKPEKAAELD